MMPHRNFGWLSQKLIPFGRFSIVGATTAAIYIAGFAAFVELGVNTAFATAAAYLAAISFQFVGHWKFTFQASINLKVTIFRFLFANGVGLLFSTAMAVAFTEGLGLNALITGFLVSIALACMNWIIFRNWVFKT